ncbi:MAG: hypothetical protein NZ901_10070 [Geminocystis sp.]|nr:hypothetical protein [Geminocystis sp.]MCS7148520.1 hypothetical protein [Geminocystis sp.]MDW8114907.1 hypothetical protein [Geminocystis sp.]MDW8464172.1 hypothetical protein [Geminocystis sp.]
MKNGIQDSYKEVLQKRVYKTEQQLKYMSLEAEVELLLQRLKTVNNNK